LGLSPSGVSRALSRLEKRVGVRLVERTTRSLLFTDEGRRFYENISPHLVGIAEAAALASGSANAVQGRLRVNVDPYFSRIALASPIVEFLGRYPDLDLELIMRDDVGDLVADGFDLAVRFGHPATSSLVMQKLARTRVLTVASPGYIKKHGRPAHPSDVAEHQRILFHNAAANKPFEWEFHKRGKKIQIAAKGRLLVSDVGTMLKACVAGAGIAQILDLGAEELLRSGALVNLFPDWNGEEFPLNILYPSRRHQPAKVNAFIDFCRDVVAPTGGP
jgi:DNA-binding transcriptional LysR family regulator